MYFQGDSPFGKSEAYVKLEQLGEGSYATVFKGFSKYVYFFFFAQYKIFHISLRRASCNNFSL